MCNALWGMEEEEEEEEEERENKGQGCISEQQEGLGAGGNVDHWGLRHGNPM